MKTYLMGLTLLSAAAVPAWSATQTTTLSVPSMDCPVCPITVRKALTRVPGVSDAKVDFARREAVVTFDDTKTRIEDLTEATRNAGYPSAVAKARE